MFIEGSHTTKTTASGCQRFHLRHSGRSTIPLTMNSPTGSCQFTAYTFGGLADFIVMEYTQRHPMSKISPQTLGPQYHSPYNEFTVRGSFAAEPFTAGTFPRRGHFVAKCLCQHKKACSLPGPFRRHKATFRAENELSKSGVRFALAALV